jgi:hypothetical protein
MATQRDRGDLRIALEVLREFKALESAAEYCGAPFTVWARLEQLEDYLEQLVGVESIPAGGR